MGSSYYASVDWTLGSFMTRFIENESGCSRLTTDAFQFQLEKKNSSHSTFELHWIGDTDCNLPLQDPLLIMKSTTTTSTVIVHPTYGYHSKVHIAGKNNSTLFLIIPKDFFVDPFELGRIDFSPFQVDVVGTVDVEVPVSSPKAMEHVLIVTGEDAKDKE
jgi:hypothetical protein